MINGSLDPTDRFYVLEMENAELRRKLALYDARNSAIKDVKEITRQISTDKGCAFCRGKK